VLRWPLGGCVVLLTLCSAPMAAQEPNWVLKSPANSPPARNGGAMAYDAARGQVVLFGGSDSNNVFYNDTWVWDGINWTQKSPANTPTPRYIHAMAYDAAHGQVVLFGGFGTTAPGARNDTWVWDGTNWTQMSPANSPTPRYLPAMAYDATHGQVVLFGGYDQNTGIRNDTWVWDGTNWTQKSPTNIPPPRSEHKMAYDVAHGQVVLFGGMGSSAMLNDTWVWDGTDWTQKSPAISPSSRAYHEMAYDAAHEQVVLFGGYDSSYRNDTWVWDGANWTQKTPANSPTPRAQHEMAYDALRGQVVLFGGWDGSGTPNDTWVWGSTSPTGTISVTTNLPAAAFTITGPTNYSGSGTSFTQTNAPAGDYTITYGTVSGYTAPSSDTRTLAGGGTISFTGTYTLVPPPTLAVSSQSLSFTYQNGVAGPLQAQTITVSSSGSPLLFTATATTASGGNWLSVAPGGGTTSAVLSVNVALGLNPGTYSGSINIASAGASNSPRAVPVTMTVTTPSTGLFVNGKKLAGPELANVLFVATNVVPQLLGDRAKRIQTAARVSFWGLQQGIFNLDQKVEQQRFLDVATAGLWPFAFSNCSVVNKKGDNYNDHYLSSAVDACAPTNAALPNTGTVLIWQVGLAGVQVLSSNRLSETSTRQQQVLNTLGQLWPGRSPSDVLAEAVILAGFDRNTGIGAGILASDDTNLLRTSWLLRHPVVGFTLEEPIVTGQCVAQPGCIAKGNPYAGSPADVLRTITDLTAIFNLLAP
jgi:Kelch motif